MDTITRPELKAKIDSQKRFSLIDAREREEFDKAHLPGAERMGPVDAPRAAAHRIPNKSSDIVIYCGGGACEASRAVAAELAAQDYEQVRIYEGGIKDWVKAKFATEATVALHPKPLGT